MIGVVNLTEPRIIQDMGLCSYLWKDILIKVIDVEKLFLKFIHITAKYDNIDASLPLQVSSSITLSATPPPFRKHLGRGGLRKTYKGWRLGRKAVKFCLLNISWLFHSWTYKRPIQDQPNPNPIEMREMMPRPHPLLRIYRQWMDAGEGENHSSLRTWPPVDF